MNNHERLVSDKNNILELYNISKRYPGVQALDDVSFSIEQASVHALIGINGAGKSTLIKILSGAVARDSGIIIFDGKEVVLNNPHEVSEIGIATIYQEPALVPSLTVEQNLFLGKETTKMLGWITKGEQREIAKNLLSDFAPHLSVDELVGSLRTSEKQLIAIAKALLTNAKLIIMDEPSAALTTHEVELIFDAVNKLKNEGQSLIYITHRLDEVFKIADTVTVLRDGKHISTRSVKGLKKSQLINIMTGKDLKIGERYRKNQISTSRCLLQVKNLSRFPNYKDISFSVHSGEIVALTGLVGAGHSELVRSIFKVDPFDSGSITYPRDPGRIVSSADVVQAGVVMIPEDRKKQGIIPKMSVGDNMMLSSVKKFIDPVTKTINSKKINNSINENIKKFDIRPYDIKNKIISTLSGGNQQKVIIARGIISEADVIIFDQPTAGVDVGAKSEIYKIITNLANQGKGILLISLEVEEVLALADRVLVLRDGVLVQELDGLNSSSHDILLNSIDNIIDN